MKRYIDKAVLVAIVLLTGVALLSGTMWLLGALDARRGTGMAMNSTTRLCASGGMFFGLFVIFTLVLLCSLIAIWASNKTSPLMKFGGLGIYAIYAVFVVAFSYSLWTSPFLLSPTQPPGFEQTPMLNSTNIP